MPANSGAQATPTHADTIKEKWALEARLAEAERLLARLIDWREFYSNPEWRRSHGLPDTNAQVEARAFLAAPGDGEPKPSRPYPGQPDRTYRGGKP